MKKSAKVPPEATGGQYPKTDKIQTTKKMHNSSEITNMSH